VENRWKPFAAQLAWVVAAPCQSMEPDSTWLLSLPPFPCCCRPHLEQYLENGVVVLADRYSYSGVAYSVAQGLPAEWCKGTEAGLPAPDLVVFLKLSPAAAAQRAGYGEERYENVGMQTKVRTPGARPWWPEGRQQPGPCLSRCRQEGTGVLQ
jgi:hypothetical protein